jgi:hypothetical protein
VPGQEKGPGLERVTEPEPEPAKVPGLAQGSAQALGWERVSAPGRCSARHPMSRRRRSGRTAT